MEEDIKVLRDETFATADEEPNIPRGNRDPEEPFFDKLDMKTSQGSSEAGVHSHANRGFSKPERVTPERSKQKEGTRRRGGRMVNRRTKTQENQLLKVHPSREIPIGDQMSQGWIPLELKQSQIGASHGRKSKRMYRGRLEGAMGGRSSEGGGWGHDSVRKHLCECS
ncbi:hypothetical protein GUJ93_ZPchr0009g1341, partial [Zizania palustris]